MPGRGVQGRNPAGGTSLAGGRAPRSRLGRAKRDTTRRTLLRPSAERSLTGRDAVTPGPKVTASSGAQIAMMWKV